jgi:hypothetical protein
MLPHQPYAMMVDPLSPRKLMAPNEVIVGELAVRGQWVVGNVSGSVPWPTKTQKVSYRGKPLYLIALMENYHPAIATLLTPGMTLEDAEKLILQFASSLAWAENYPIVIDSIGGGNIPRPMGAKTTHNLICDELDVSYLPEPEDERARLGLAYYREGLSLTHPAYAFLAFFKILEVAFPKGKQRSKWVAANLSAVGHRARSVLKSLEQKHEDVGKHLFESGRCAAAHASMAPRIDPDNPADRQRLKHEDVGKHLFESGRCAAAHASMAPSIDPDNPADRQRLTFELPLIQELAILAIETKLGIKTSQSVYREHLYELAGFKQLFGSEIIKKITQPEQLTEADVVNIPMLRVDVIGQPEYEPLVRMTATSMTAGDGKAFITLKSNTATVWVRFVLDFLAERLLFDIRNDIRIEDDQTASGALACAEALRFVRDYWGNGRLRMSNAETGEMLSRKDAFLPENVIPDYTFMDAHISEWRAKAEARRGCE